MTNGKDITLFKTGQLFKWMHHITLISVFLLIFIGGLVRSTGAGMGCPDWPKCFGSWIPPIYESQLPADYQIQYANQGYATMRFDAVKTWTEYFNRLFGVWVGLAIIGLFITSFYAYRDNKKIVFWSGLSLLLVILQGALGAYVVKSNLHPNIITLHMILAIALLLAITLAGHFSESSSRTHALPPSYLPLLRIGFYALLFQMVLGTQVRQLVDPLMSAEVLRSEWVFHLGLKFVIHRSFSWILLIIGLVTVWSMRHTKPLRKWLLSLIFILSCEFILGISMIYMDFPKISQPLHLLLACILIWVYWKLILKVRTNYAP